jgi:hypothetical protein
MPILGAQSAGTKGLPTAPTIGTATVTNATTASVTFTAPSFSKLPITSYTVTASPGGVTGAGSSSPITVSGLTTGTAYTFAVTATSTAGTSSASAASNSITPAYDSLLLASRYTNNNSGFSTLTNTGDSSGGVIVGLNYSNSAKIQKYSSSGSLVFQKTTSYSGYSFSKMSTSGSNTYNAWQQDGYNWQVIDSSGTLSTAYNYTNANVATPQGIASNAGTYYFAGTRDSSAFFSRVNSSGTNDLAINVTASDGRQFGLRQITYDSSGNIYTTGYYDAPTAYEAFICKWNSSGVLQWKTRLTRSGSNIFAYNIAVNSTNGDVYVVASGVFASMFLKLNSSGVVQWQTSFNNVTTQEMVVDSSGNMYVATADTPRIVKYDSSGSLQWQRQITSSYGSLRLRDGGNGNYSPLSLSNDQQHLIVTVSGDANATPNHVSTTLKIPVDGSKTGTYSSVVIPGYSITYATTSILLDSFSLTSDTAGISLNTSSFTLTRTAISPTGSTDANIATDLRVI